MPRLSRAEIAGFIIAVLGIGAMGVIVFAGPFHNINKTQAKSAFPPVTVKVITATGSLADEIGLYRPKSITVHIGQPVVWVNDSNADHTVTEDSNPAVFDSLNLAQRASYTFTPKIQGTFHYHCQYHPLMHGTIFVVP
jgi:plastocyanin